MENPALSLLSAQLWVETFLRVGPTCLSFFCYRSFERNNGSFHDYGSFRPPPIHPSSFLGTKRTLSPGENTPSVS